MKNKLVAATFLVLACATAPPAAATAVTQTYVGNITGSSGVRADAFPVGATVLLSYTVDTTVADYDSEPGQGVYFGGLPVLAIEVPDSNFGLVAEAGAVYAYNNFNNEIDPISDFALLFSHNVVEADSIQGLPVIFAQVDFFDYEYVNSTPTMISNDAIPTEKLKPDIVYMYLGTSTDPDLTRFSIALLPSATTVSELVAEAKLRISNLVEQNGLDVGVRKSLIAKLEAVLAASYAGRKGACGALTGLRNQIDSMSRRNAAEAGVAVELNQVITALQSALGGC